MQGIQYFQLGSLAQNLDNEHPLLHFEVYKGWGVQAKSLILVPDNPLPRCTPMPQYDLPLTGCDHTNHLPSPGHGSGHGSGEGNGAADGGGSSGHAVKVGIGVGVGVGVTLLLLAVAGLGVAAARARTRRGAGNRASSGDNKGCVHAGNSIAVALAAMPCSMHVVSFVDLALPCSASRCVPC